ncbi:cyclase family protein [Ruminococcus sp.]|uniref:cyclase family protein n=1 Tax=Ruminococcus sp. TaxID=41978 RepID=UPI0025D9304A|nr:cyclase family protein [Ruminococcus sp.]MCI6616775.1 cyclase family protein [Ruminococcus sp.]
MIIHDISRDTINTPVYDGDPETRAQRIKSIENGDGYNLTEISMSVHSGTHIDAPLHFYDEGSSIDNIRLNTFFGKCTVISVSGILTGEDMERLLPYCKRRVLFHGEGKTFISHSAAIVLAESRVVLVGTDAQSIAPSFDEERTHRELARAGIVILENLNLSAIDDGEYDLCAFPIKLGGLEAAPCRAIILEQEKGLN